MFTLCNWKKRFYVKLDGKTVRNPLCIYNIRLYPLDIKMSTALFISFSLLWRITPMFYYLLFCCLRHAGFIHSPATAWNVCIWYNMLRYQKLRQHYWSEWIQEQVQRWGVKYAIDFQLYLYSLLPFIRTSAYECPSFVSYPPPPPFFF